MKALEFIDSLYPQKEGGSISQQLSLQLAEPKPWDLSQTDLSHYRAITPPYADWQEIKRRLYAAAQKIALSRL